MNFWHFVRIYIWEILWFVAVVLLVGALGNIEISETLPKGSVVLAAISEGYILLYVAVRCATSSIDKETWEEMERDWNKIKKWW